LFKDKFYFLNVVDFRNNLILSHLDLYFEISRLREFLVQKIRVARKFGI
jgi:hypothetical protein